MMKELKTEPGFYLSDIDPEHKQHLFAYHTNPTRIICIGCGEMCYADPEAAKIFTAKHGYLGKQIALRIEPLCFVDPNIEPFPVDPKWVKESLGIDIEEL
jgi:hypothetical protein